MKIATFRGPWRFLSNFFGCQFEWYNKTYKSVEHAYQAAKFIGSDAMMVEQIRMSDNPADAKALGRCAGMRSDWEVVKLDIMEELLRLKFAPGTDLAQKLLDTSTAELEEGNSWGDHWWGVCDGVGENHLGKLLMKVRERLKQKATKRDEQKAAASGGETGGEDDTEDLAVPPVPS